MRRDTYTRLAVALLLMVICTSPACTEQDDMDDTDAGIDTDTVDQLEEPWFISTFGRVDAVDGIDIPIEPRDQLKVVHHERIDFETALVIVRPVLEKDDVIDAFIGDDRCSHKHEAEDQLLHRSPPLLDQGQFLRLNLSAQT